MCTTDLKRAPKGGWTLRKGRHTLSPLCERLCAQTDKLRIIFLNVKLARDWRGFSPKGPAIRDATDILQCFH